MTLPAAIREKISNVQGIDSSIFLKWLPRAETSFGILNFQMQWEQFIIRFDGEVMYGLEVCSDVLSKQYPENIISESSLSQLKTEVEELLSALTLADIPNDLKRFIWKTVTSIQKKTNLILLGSYMLQPENFLFPLNKTD